MDEVTDNVSVFYNKLSPIMTSRVLNFLEDVSAKNVMDDGSIFSISLMLSGNTPELDETTSRANQFGDYVGKPTIIRDDDNRLLLMFELPEQTDEKLSALAIDMRMMSGARNIDESDELLIYPESYNDVVDSYLLTFGDCGIQTDETELTEKLQVYVDGVDEFKGRMQKIVVSEDKAVSLLEVDSPDIDFI